MKSKLSKILFSAMLVLTMGTYRVNADPIKEEDNVDIEEVQKEDQDIKEDEELTDSEDSDTKAADEDDSGETNVAKRYTNVVAIVNGERYEVSEEDLILDPDGDAFEISSLTLELTDEDGEVDTLAFDGTFVIPAGSNFTIYYKNGPSKDPIRGSVKGDGATASVISKSISKEYLYAGAAVAGIIVLGGGAFIVVKKKKGKDSSHKKVDKIKE